MWWDNADTAPIQHEKFFNLQHIASLMSILLLFVVSGANGATLSPTLALTSAEA